MFEKPKAEMPKAQGGAETIVGTSVKLKGNIKSDGDIIIDGIVTGELKTKGSVMIGDHANILANIRAQNVRISGAVQGNIVADDKLEITSTGKVLGDISASILSISPGAVFTGKSQMAEAIPVEVEPVIEIETSVKDEKKTEKKDK